MSDLAGQLRPGMGLEVTRLRRPAILEYVERPDAADEDLDRWVRNASGAVISRGASARARRLREILRETSRFESQMRVASDRELQERARALRVELRGAMEEGRLSVRAAGPAFALIREASERVVGLRHYDVQMVAGWALMKGMIAEMQTGEGKTLAATLAASTAALAGVPVHIITVNDYLAERDAEEMGPLYRFLGLSVATVVEGQEHDARKERYAADIVYGTNKEIAFDYLRDRMELKRRPGNLRRKLDRLAHDGLGEKLRMRGVHFAIIDEADSVLIDEARTPLVISGQVAGAAQDASLYQRAMAASRQLTEGTDYRFPKDERRIELLDAGSDRLEDLVSEDETGPFAIRAIREHAVVQALTAQHLFHRDEDYLVRDGKVQIVDENTGRIMADRSWSEGLHQLVELKEGVEVTPPRENLSRITYQRFFRRYRHLSGMTGTARDAAWEFWSVYQLRVARIPTRRPDVRQFAADRVFLDQKSKWDAIGDRVRELHAAGRPILLGTRSVAASEAASARLSELGISHEVLSAAQDADEAERIARAGKLSSVLVATNMAGRGTDIRLGEGVADRGGLHVILTERHDSGRVDRQLEGRCGRQGDPGRVETFLSLDDELMRARGARMLLRLARAALVVAGPRAAALAIRYRQKRVERLHARMRRDLLDADRNLGNLLSVSGPME